MDICAVQKITHCVWQKQLSGPLKVDLTYWKSDTSTKIFSPPLYLAHGAEQAVYSEDIPAVQNNQHSYHTSTCRQTNTHAYLQAYTLAHTYARAYTHMHACTHTHTHTHICTHTHTHACTHTHTHACTHTHTHTRAHTHTHTHTHTQPRKHTHTHTYACT